MSYRATIALAVILLLVILTGVLVTVNRGRSTPTHVAPPSGSIYEVPEASIRTISILNQGKRETFVRDPQGTWRFAAADGEPVDLKRWGGVPLLLSGPQFQRLLVVQATDLEPYGLREPKTTVDLSLTGGLKAQIQIGDQTPTGENFYVKIADQPAVYLVDQTWPKVIIRLVSEPPHEPTPAPPAPTAAAAG